LRIRTRNSFNFLIYLNFKLIYKAL